MPHAAAVFPDLKPARTSTILRIGGEVDRAGSVGLRAQLDAHCHSTSGDLVVDCENMLLIDSAGAEMLFDVGRSLDAAGRALHLVRVPTGACRRLLATHGLHSVMEP